MINNISEHILGVAIDLREAEEELKDATIKVAELNKKLAQLIKIQEKILNKNDDSNNNDSSVCHNNCLVGGSCICK